MARLPLVPDEASPEVAAAYAEIARRRGRVLNVFRVLGHAPEGLRRLAAVGEYARFLSSLPDRLRELVTLATAQANRCQYEWAQHVPLAQAAGLTPEEITALAAGSVPRSLGPAERAAVAYARQLVRRRRVSDATFRRLTAHFEARAITDLTLLVAYYTALGLALNALEVDLEPGQTPLLPRTRPRR